MVDSGRSQSGAGSSGPPFGQSASNMNGSLPANGNYANQAPRPLQLPVEQRRGIAFALMVFRRWWRIGIPAAIMVAGALAAVVWYRFTPQYEASAWLRFDERTPFLAFSDNSEGSKAFLQTQIELIRSPLVLGPAVQRPEITKLFDQQRKEDTIESLAKQLKIQPIGESELYKLSYDSTDPQAAAAIVNAVVGSYFSHPSDAERTQRIVALLEKEKASRLKEVDRLRQELGATARQLTGHEDYTFHPAGDLNGKTAASDLQAKLIEAQAQTAVLQARLEAAEFESHAKAAHAGTSAAPASSSIDSTLQDQTVETALWNRPEVQKASDAIAAKEAQQVEIESRIKDGTNDPVYKQLGLEIIEGHTALESLKKSLRGTIAKQTDAASQLGDLTKLRDDLEAHKILDQRLEEAYNKELLNGKQFSGGTLALQFKHDELERAEKVFELIATRELQLQTEQMAPTRASVLQMAEAPQAPSESIPMRGLALAVLIGGMLPFGLALGWEGWARRVSDASELPKTLGLPIVGEIARRPPRVISVDKAASRRSELEFRVYRESIDNLQTALTLSEHLKSMRVVAVTSAVSYEGKTSVASQLAISLARATRQRVLLIDGDMRSPDIHRFFKIDRDPGLAAVLSKKCEFNEAIVTSWSDRVHLVPAGKLTDSPLSLLAEGAMQEILSRVPPEYRYIVIDTPPVLAASESLILAKAADAALICTMRDRSRMAQVSLVRDRLTAAGCRLAGIVFSGVPTKTYQHRYGNYDYLASVGP